MKKIRNCGKYSISFRAIKNGVEREFAFPARRIFADTGNVACEGVVVMTDEEFAFLNENVKVFADEVKNGGLSVEDGGKDDENDLFGVKKSGKKQVEKA